MATCNKATFKDRLAVSKVMEAVIVSVTPDTCRYINGYSDQKVADECGVSIFTAQNVRRELYGQLIKKAPVATLEERVRCIEEYLTRQNPGFVPVGEN